MQHINAQKTFLGRDSYYSRYIFERYYITIPCGTTMSAKEYEKNLSDLFSLAKRQNLQASFPHGVISSYCDGRYTGSNMFLEDKQRMCLRRSLATSTTLKGAGNPAPFNLSMNIHSCHIRFAVALNHAEKLPAVSFIEAHVVCNEIYRTYSLRP